MHYKCSRNRTPVRADRIGRDMVAFDGQVFFRRNTMSLILASPFSGSVGALRPPDAAT